MYNVSYSLHRGALSLNSVMYDTFWMYIVTYIFREKSVVSAFDGSFRRLNFTRIQIVLYCNHYHYVLPNL